MPALYNWTRRKLCEVCHTEIRNHSGNSRWCVTCRPTEYPAEQRRQRVKRERAKRKSA